MHDLFITNFLSLEFPFVFSLDFSRQNLTSVEYAIVIPFVAEKKFELSDVVKGCSLKDFLSFGVSSSTADPPPLEFQQVSLPVFPISSALGQCYSKELGTDSRYNMRYLIGDNWDRVLFIKSFKNKTFTTIYLQWSI